MVWHQAEGQQRHTRVVTGSREELDKVLVVITIVEDALARVPAIHHVLHVAREQDPWSSRHGRRMSESTSVPPRRVPDRNTTPSLGTVPVVPSQQMTRIVRPTRRDFLRLAALTGLGTAALGVPRGSLRAASPLFEEIPSSVSGITWVHDNAMSPDRFLPETMGPGVAFVDYDNDGWMDLFMVNSGASRFLHAENPAQERALQEQPRRHLHRRHRQGGLPTAGISAWASPSATSTTTATRTCSSPTTGRATLYHNNGNGTFTDVTEKAGLLDGPGLDDQRRLVRLRQRRQAGSVSLQLRRSSR